LTLDGTALFFLGMLLATARNDVVLFPFLALHALWHLVSAFAFVASGPSTTCASRWRARRPSQ
jgi:hypothetical protein